MPQSNREQWVSDLHSSLGWGARTMGLGPARLRALVLRSRGLWELPAAPNSKREHWVSDLQSSPNCYVTCLFEKESLGL